MDEYFLNASMQRLGVTGKKFENLLLTMAIRVVEFSSEGYKIRKIFA